MMTDKTLVVRVMVMIDRAIFGANKIKGLNMQINKIDIKDIGGIPSLSLEFSPRMNIICGPNGVGKTTILEAISHIFTGYTNSALLKKRFASEVGTVHFEIEDLQRQYVENKSYDVGVYLPLETFYAGREEVENDTKKLLSFKVSRVFQYKELTSINRDPNLEYHHIWDANLMGVDNYNFKDWFVNRYLFSAHPGNLSEAQLANFELAKACFSKLNSGYSFNKVDAGSNDILINTPRDVIYYEYLSSGFKSSLSILFGIIKEIEHRFKDVHMVAEDYDGIVLIDEIEIHLHPEWQSRICHILKVTFPKAQFFITTHSPHVIQTAEADEVIALADNGSEIVRRDISSAKYGFKGWTIEEVLTDVMGMESTTTDVLKTMVDEFYEAVDNADLSKAKAILTELNNALHPNNHLRKILELEMVGFRGSDD